MSDNIFNKDTAKRYKLARCENVYTIVQEETAYADGSYAIAMYGLSEDGTYWEPWDILTTNLRDQEKRISMLLQKQINTWILYQKT